VSASAALQIPAPPIRRINDYAGALSAAERERLEQKLAARERDSSNQIVVGIFRSLEGESLEDVSIRLAQAWRVGRKGLDNGVIFLVFLDDRKMRLEVGYGLEGTLTDATAASIIREVVAPRFREGRLADGIDAGLDAIEQAIAGTYGRARPAPGPAAPIRAYAIPLFVLLVLGFAVFTSIQSQRLSRRRGWTGGRGGWVVGSPGLGGSSWGGDRSAGGSDSSGSFSGGGGSFGGGGASGEW
jgi:uncharacterized protein